MEMFMAFFYQTNAELRRKIDQLLAGAPDGDAQGEVEVRRYQNGRGRPVYAVAQFSHDGGWESPETDSLALATLAAECLALSIGAVWAICRQCDQDERAGS